MKIQHQVLSYEIYKRSKSKILANEFEAGAKQKQEQIAAMFGVSRMPLHRAFQMLENEDQLEYLKSPFEKLSGQKKSMCLNTLNRIREHTHKSMETLRERHKKNKPK